MNWPAVSYRDWWIERMRQTYQLKTGCPFIILHIIVINTFLWQPQAGAAVKKCHNFNWEHLTWQGKVFTYHECPQLSNYLICHLRPYTRVQLLHSICTLKKIKEKGKRCMDNPKCTSIYPCYKYFVTDKVIWSNIYPVQRSEKCNWMNCLNKNPI